MSQPWGSRSPIWDPQEGPRLGEAGNLSRATGGSPAVGNQPTHGEMPALGAPESPIPGGDSHGDTVQTGVTPGGFRVPPTQWHHGGGHGRGRTATVTRSHHVATNSQQSTGEWKHRRGGMGAVPDPPMLALSRAGYWGATGMGTSMAGWALGEPRAWVPPPWQGRVVGVPRMVPQPWGQELGVTRMVAQHWGQTLGVPRTMAHP